jgi:plastocyanin
MKAIIIIIIIAIVGLGIYAYTGSENSSNVSTPTPTTPTPSPTPTVPIVKEFTVNGQNYSFSPSTLSVKKGDIVKITFKNAGGMHDLRIEGYNVGTSIIQNGAQETFQFVADKSGTFEYYCSVGTHRQMGMKGTLTVTEN